MLTRLSNQVAVEWDGLPEADKAIVTGAAVVFGMILLVVVAALFLVTP